MAIESETKSDSKKHKDIDVFVLQVKDFSDENAPYDPHVHRVIENPTTDRETLIHLLKGCLGTGILAMPNAFYNSGLLVGVISTLLIGILCTYCLHVLVRAQYELCKRRRVPILTYPETMRIALEQGPQRLRIFAKLSAPMVDGFLITYQLGICCVYILFVASSIKQVVDHYWMVIDVRIHMLIILVPLILLSYIRNLKLLAPVSQFANFITFAAIGITLYYIFDKLPPVDSVDMFGSASNYVLYVGTTLFALEAVGVVIALENNMKTPKSFGGWFGVLNKGMAFITLLYIAVGFFGYIKYGSGALGSVTLNLPNEEVLAQSVKLIFAIAIFITYALQAYVPIEIIWNTYLKRKFGDSDNKVLIQYIMRTVIVISTFILAVLIPRLELFISLFGAFCLSALGIAFPAIIDLCVLWPDKLGKCNYILYKDIILAIVGILALIIGTYTSIYGIVKSFQ